MSKKLTTEEVEKRINLIDPSILILSKYQNDKIKLSLAYQDAPEIIYDVRASHFFRHGNLSIKTARNKTACYIYQCQKIHGNFYDYSKTIWLGSQKDLTVVCPIHGEFTTKANNHVRGMKCRKCRDEARKGGESFYENPENWYKSAVLYLLEFTNDQESFYKFGVSVDIHKRVLKLKQDTNYNYEILVKKLKHSTVFDVYYNLEPEINKLVTYYKYKPLMKFNGYTECFQMNDLNTITNKYV